MALTSLLQNPNPNPNLTSLSPLSVTLTRHRLLHHNHHHHHLFFPRRRHVTIPLSLKSSSSSSSPQNPKPQTPLQTLSQVLNPIKTHLYIALAAAALFLCSTRSPLLRTTPHSPAFACVTAVTEKEKSLVERLEIVGGENDVELLREVFDVLVERNEVKGAMVVINRLIEIEPAETQWKLMRAHLYGYLRKNGLAREGFDELLETNPRDVKAYHGLIMVVGNEMEKSVYNDELEKVRERIEAELEKCREEGNEKDVRDFRFLEAQILFFENKTDEGLKVYEELLEEDPTDFRVYLCQGVIYTLTGKKEEGEKCFKLYKKYLPKRHAHTKDFDGTMNASKKQAQEMEERRVAEEAAKAAEEAAEAAAQ